MIQSRSISRNEESSIFASIINNNSRNESENQTQQQNYFYQFEDPEMIQFQIERKAFLVCKRCGEIGHEAIECTKTKEGILKIPEEIEEKRKDYIQEILKKGEYSYDQFGPYLPQGNEKKGDSWENTVFCVNCGEPGHLWTQCKYTLFSQIFDNSSNNQDLSNKYPIFFHPNDE